jgi:hypothetical protein
MEFYGSLDEVTRAFLSGMETFCEEFLRGVVKLLLWKVFTNLPWLVSGILGGCGSIRGAPWLAEKLLIAALL